MEQCKNSIKRNAQTKTIQNRRSKSGRARATLATSDMGNLMKLGSDTPLLLLILIIAAISCQGPRMLNQNCNACVRILSSIKTGLGSNSTADEIKEVVNGTCKVTRMQFKVPCEDITKKNYTKLVKLISKTEKPIEICKILRYCK